MSKIGILGGTFNPIHLGHINLAKTAYKQLNLDKVLIIPTGLSYLKVDKHVLSKEQRAEMVRLSIKDINYFEMSDIEINKEGNTYTFETLEDLHRIYKDDEFYFIIGADTLFSIESWMKPQIVLKLAKLAVMVRDDSDINDIKYKAACLINKYSADIKILNSPKMDISSTYIRDEISLGNIDKVKSLLNEEVYNYIKNNMLYA